MALITDLRELGQYFVDKLNDQRLEILTEGVGFPSTPAFATCEYGEPRVISEWPFLSVQPQTKTREIKTTHKYHLGFTLWLILYHGKVGATLGTQNETHLRIEAVERWVRRSRKFNYTDPSDISFDRVINGFPAYLDHPVVLAPEQELWASSRIEVQAQSEEAF